MKNTQRGFIGITIIILIALVAVGGGAYVYRQNKVAKTPVTAEVSVKTDSQDDKVPVVVVNQEQLNKRVSEKYGNTAGVNRQIKARAQAEFTSFAVQANIIQSRDGSFKNVCADAKSFIEADISKSLAEDDGLMAALGITLSSYNIDQIICKAAADNFIITMPIYLEDGSPAKVCSSATALGFIGDANYETYTCIKK